jgi:AcrR family transcriptional regulator
VSPIRERFRKEVLTTIAEAAEQVFAEQGLRDAHVGLIAKRAGVAVGTLYNYYKDRDALLVALIDQRQDELFEALDRAIDSVAPPAPFQEQLLAFVLAYFAFLTTHRLFLKILMEGELMHLQTALPRAASVHIACHKRIFQRMEELFAAGAESGAIRPDAASLGPWLVMGMMRGIAIRDLRGYKTYEPVDASMMVDIFVRGAT